MGKSDEKGKRSYWMCFHSYSRMINILSDEEAGRLFKAILFYSDHYETDQLDMRDAIIGNEIYLYEVMIDQVQRDSEAYADKSGKRSEAGHNGGNASGETRRAKAQAKREANASYRSNCFENEANEAKRSKRSEEEGEEEGEGKGEEHGDRESERREIENTRKEEGDTRKGETHKEKEPVFSIDQITKDLKAVSFIYHLKENNLSVLQNLLGHYGLSKLTIDKMIKVLRDYDMEGLNEREVAEFIYKRKQEADFARFAAIRSDS